MIKPMPFGSFWCKRPAVAGALVGLLISFAGPWIGPAHAGTIYHYRDEAGVRTYTNLAPAEDIAAKIQSSAELAAEAPPHPTPGVASFPGRRLDRAVTAVHRGLALFRRRAPVDADLERLDRLIQAAGARLPPTAPASKAAALRLLTEIDILIDAQAPSFAVYIDARDCRRSLLYTAIGEAYNLPIALAATPGHLLVHYRLPDGSAIYWETTAARAVPAEFYIRRYRLSENSHHQESFLKPLPPAAVLARFHRELADDAKNKGRLQAAEDHYSQSIHLYPDDYVSYTQRGSVRARLRRFDEAAEDYFRALAIYPNDPVTHYNLGSLLARRRRFTDALAALDTAIGLDPSYQKAIVLRDRIRARH